MYYTKKYTDRLARMIAVHSNTIEMVNNYFEKYAAMRVPENLIKNHHLETEELIGQWIDDNPNANFADIQDFVTGLVEDFREMLHERNEMPAPQPHRYGN